MTASRYAVEVALSWGGVALYVASALAFAAAVIFGRAGARRWAVGLALAGLLPHGVGIVLRWMAVGHGPYMLKYEVLSSNGWVAIAVLLGILAWRPSWTVLGMAIMPIAILSVALGLTSNPELRELPPTLRSLWLVFHVIFAKISAAAFLVSTGAAILMLVGARPRPPAWTARAPPLATLEALVLRSAGLGLVFWTMTIAAGAIWGNQSWGRYWGWDPIETWSLVAWLAYGSFLHVRFFFKLGARATAWLAVACFAVFVSVLGVLPFVISSLHSAYFS